MLLFVWLPPTVFGGPDFIRYFDPYLGYLRATVLAGELPWWNPYASLGRPFFADLQTASLYPANYLSVLFGLKTGWMLATVAHGALGLWGFDRLARWAGASRAAACGGAVVFLFCAPLLARMQVGTINYTYSWCYFPAGLWLACRVALAPDRRVWAGLVLVWGLQLLSGHPQPFWLSLVGTGAFVAMLLLQPPWRTSGAQLWRTGLLLAGALACALALCGIVLVPFLELAGQSNRAEMILTYAAKSAMTPAYWMSLLTAPSAMFAINWEYNMYVGVAAALGGVAMLARWRDPVARAAAGMIALGVVIGLGQATPLFAFLFQFLPGLSSFRIPARAAVLVAFGLLIAASALAGRGGKQSRRGVLLGGLGLLAATGAFYVTSMPPAATGWLSVQWLLILLAGAGWWFWLDERPAPSALARSARWLLPVVVLLGVRLGIPDLSQVQLDTREFPAEAMVVSAIKARHLDRNPAPVRVCLPFDLMRENSGMVRDYATLTGFESLSLGRVWNYLHLAAGADPHYGFNSSPPQAVYDRADRFGSVNLSIWLPPQSGSLVINPAPDPRAYVATRVTAVADASEAIRRMLAGHPFHEDALVETPLDLGHSGRAEPGQAAITRFTANALELNVDTPAGGLLVVAEAWYPGWRAEINGREVPCLPVNGWMRGIPVPAGHSVVQLSYHQNGLVLGGTLSLAAAALLAWAAFSRPTVRPIRVTPDSGA